jgi:hypothetical protein
LITFVEILGMLKAIKDVVGTSLDVGEQLDALGKLSEGEQSGWHVQQKR